ncbi:unnamed protein product, partial [Strongylus vulgaris]
SINCHVLRNDRSKYKLIYFNARAIAEVARQIFALAGQPYEDVRVNPKEWPKLKKGMPFEQLPVLEVDGKRIAQSYTICRFLARRFEVDGKRIAQSYTICRFLARRFGFAGHTPFEEAVVDSIVDQFRDYLFETRPFLVSLIGVGDGDVDTLKKKLFLPERAKLFGYMKKFLNHSSSGFLVGDSLTWADLCLAEHVATYCDMFPEMLEGYPEVRKAFCKIASSKDIARTGPESISACICDHEGCITNNYLTCPISLWFQNS